MKNRVAVGILLALAALELSSEQLELMKRTRHFGIYGDSDARAYIEDISALLEGNYDRYCEILGWSGRDVVVVEVFKSLKVAIGFPFDLNGYAGNGKIQLNAPCSGGPGYDYMLRVPLHELVHVLFARAVDGVSERWMREGIAEYVSGGPRTLEERAGILESTVRGGKLPEYGQLNSAFSESDKAASLMAYSVSAGFMEFLVHEYGLSRFRKLMRKDLVFLEVYGSTAKDLYANYCLRLVQNNGRIMIAPRSLD